MTDFLMGLRPSPTRLVVRSSRPTHAARGVRRGPRSPVVSSQFPVFIPLIRAVAAEVQAKLDARFKITAPQAVLVQDVRVQVPPV